MSRDVRARFELIVFEPGETRMTVINSVNNALKDFIGSFGPDQAQFDAVDIPKLEPFIMCDVDLDYTKTP